MMDLQTRKIHFIQEFLKLTNEQLIEKLEKLLFQGKKESSVKKITKMSIEQFDKMIDQSEIDAKQGKVIEAEKLLKEIDSWT
jgi:hypothetical protein